MRPTLPNSPFATRMSGSAKEVELHLNNIFLWKKKRPPAVLLILAALAALFCSNLVSCQSRQEPSSAEEAEQDIVTPKGQVVPLEGQAISPNGKYEVRLVGRNDGMISAGLAPPESVQVCDTQTDEVLWECEGLYGYAALWSLDGSYLALARTAQTYCTVTVVETETWTSRDVTLPDGGAIPEYVFLPDEEPWGVWLEENDLLLTVGRGEDANEDSRKVYRCMFAMDHNQLTGSTLEQFVERYSLHTADGRLLELILWENGGVRGEWNYRSVEQIQVYEGDHLLQTIDTSALTCEGPYLYEGLFVNKGYTIGEPDVRDVNFDGSEDFGLLAVKTYPNNVPYGYFLWDDESEQFVFSFFLSAFPRLDEVEEEVIERMSMGVQNYYEFDADGRLQLIRTVQPNG